ncbi:MAG: hypothetical protein ACLQPD_22400 [Desulfomonilaceae bacterium]
MTEICRWVLCHVKPQPCALFCQARVCSKFGEVLTILCACPPPPIPLEVIISAAGNSQEPGDFLMHGSDSHDLDLYGYCVSFRQASMKGE